MQQDTHKTNAQLSDELRELRQQNSELEEKKAFCETIMESILNGVWVSDKDDVLFYANKGMEIISGLPITQITRGNLFENFQEKTLKDFTPLYLKAKEKLEPVYYNSIPVITPAGRQSYQSGWLVPRIKNGIYDGMICTVEDVTSRKAAEEELVKSRELLEERVAERTVELLKANQRTQKEIEERKQVEESLRESEGWFSAIADYTYDWESWVGLDGELIWVNPAVEKITGYSVEEYLHLPGRLKQLFGDEGKDKILFHIERGTKKQQAENDVEFRLTCKDGSLKWVSVSYQPIYSKRGECLGLRSSIRDITDRKQIEEALRESEERFRSVAESSSDAILMSDQRGAIIFWNKAAGSMFGYEAKEIIGKSYNRLLPERLRDQDQKARQQFLKTGMLSNNKQPLETIALRKDGSEFPVEITFSSWKVQDQHCFSFIMRDIRERKQQEETLKMGEARYRELVNHSKNAIVIYEAIDDGRDFIFREFNHAAENIEHIKKEALIGKFLTEVFPGVKEFGLLEVLRRVWKTGKPEESPVAFYQDERISGWRENYAYKLPSGEIVVIYENITERKREEEALRESEERFRIIFENAGIGITLVDSKGRFLKVNKALEKIYGYSVTELSAMSFSEITHPDDVQGNIEIFTELMEGKRECYQLEKRYVGKHNRAVWSRLTVSLLRNSSGSPQYALSMVEDITERKQQEEALRESEERFRAIAESSSDAIITTDGSGKIHYWNKAAESLYGYTVKEIVGKSIELLRPEGKRLTDRKKRKYFIKTGHSFQIGKTIEGGAIKKDGTEFPTETSTSYWKMGDQIFFSGIVRDITERKQVERELKKAHEDLEKKVKQRTAELAKTNKELQRSQEHLKKFSGKLLSIRETERKNISAALHDELGSMVVAVSSAISIAREEAKNGNKQAILKALEKSEAALRKAVVDLRRLAVDLRPLDLEIVGLPNALKNHIDTLKKSSKVTIGFRVDLTDQAIPEDAAIVLYRVAQESLTNILKHSKAKKALVRLHGHKSSISIDISDDGVGFNPGKLRRKKAITRIGIQGMREQVESKGGEFIITSAPKQGTQVQATLPKKRVLDILCK